MRKPIRSKLAWLFLGLLPLLLIACSGGAAPETPAPAADEPNPPTVEPTIEEILVEEEVMEEVEAPAPATDEPDPPTAEPTLEEPQAEEEVMEEVEAEIEEEVMPVSAKPQLIEFYADW
jgi:hypothetical protein